ncbi:MAG: N-acetylmuramoyl-L-alanine amidase [Alphaproteobacteria bacterium]|nr:N-acetylmuramoyl-L-alanine amidase [Alphaproteobacteria bacterium]
MKRVFGKNQGLLVIGGLMGIMVIVMVIGLAPMARAEMPQALTWGTALRAGTTRIVVGFSALPDYAIRPHIKDDKDGNTSYSLVLEAAAKKGKIEDRKLTTDLKQGLIKEISTKTQPNGIAIAIALNTPVIVRQHFIIPAISRLSKEALAAQGADKIAPEQKIWRVVIDIIPTESEKFMAMGVMPSSRPMISSESDLGEGGESDPNSPIGQAVGGHGQNSSKEQVQLSVAHQKGDDNMSAPLDPSLQKSSREHNNAHEGKATSFRQKIGLIFTKQFWVDAASLEWFADLFADDGALNPKNLGTMFTGLYERSVSLVEGKTVPNLSPSALTENINPQIDPLSLIPIAIDPGHGGADPGAIGGDKSMEKNITLDYAMDIKGILESYGKYRVIMTRKDDSFLRLRERVALARADNAVLMVSIHADSWSDPGKYGAALYTLSESATDKEAATLAAKENKSDILAGVNISTAPPVVVSSLIDLAQRDANRHSIALARYILSEIKTQIRMAQHPYRAAGFAVLTAPDLPSVLIELGYLSNPTERSRINNPLQRKKLAAAIARGIDKYVTQNRITAASIK